MASSPSVVRSMYRSFLRIAPRSFPTVSVGVCFVQLPEKEPTRSFNYHIINPETTNADVCDLLW